MMPISQRKWCYITRANCVTGPLPEREGSAAQPEMAGQPLARSGPLHPAAHAVRQDVGLDHFQEQRGRVPEVEEVPLPGPLPVTAVPEPAAADTGYLVLVAVGPRRVGDLLPEPDNLALHVVDQHPLIRVGPAVEPAHLQRQRDIADLV